LRAPANRNQNFIDRANPSHVQRCALAPRVYRGVAKLPQPESQRLSDKADRGEPAEVSDVFVILHTLLLTPAA
jgi:hypothetical protein